MKKINLTENQVYVLIGNLLRENIQANAIKTIKLDLDKNYSPITKFVRKGGEYVEMTMVEIKADGEVITIKALFEYLSYKYKLKPEFIKQVINDWVFNLISDDFTLSKNVSLT